MPDVETSGPRITQIVIYKDAVYGNIPALITAVSRTDGTVSLTTFPPGVAPQNQTGVSQDYRGINTGSWRYRETQVS